MVRDKSGNGPEGVIDYTQHSPISRLSAGAVSKSITPSDTELLTDVDGNPAICRGIEAGSGGTVSFENERGKVLSITVSAGSPRSLRATKIRQTGTSATTITAYF